MKKTICLNMIVKDESAVILRCLSSVLPLIDYWVIVDTGSNDNTPKIIQQFFKEKSIPGKLYKQTWIDFSTNRNQALELAKGHGDYFLFIDADEQLVYEKGFKLPPLKKDYYNILCDNEGVFNFRKQLVKADLDWSWVGMVHEVVVSEKGDTNEILQNVYNLVSLGGGARSLDPKTRENDAKLLEEEIKKDPKNSRALFYLAGTYMLLGKIDLALKTYKKRAQVKGFSEEKYLSLLNIAKIEEGLHKSPEKVIKAYIKAIHSRPNRAESYYYLASFYRRQKNWKLAYEVAKKGMEYPSTEDVLPVENFVYLYGMAMEYALAAYALGDPETARAVSLSLLEKPNLPEKVRSFITAMWK